jgi:putative transposase
MPNHFHGILHIIELDNSCRAGEVQPSFGCARPAPTEVKTLGQLIGAFKTVSAKRINQIRHSPGMPVWQRNCYEHIIRNETEYEDIWNYIDINRNNWVDDHLNPYYVEANG